MIDYFAIGLTHGLLALAIWRLLQRDDLDTDNPRKPPKRKWQRAEAMDAAEPANPADHPRDA